ncbi:MAG TPA: putative ABC exporter domain-containing protein [Firmicutes bacterium]|nr:putative ABC exporter domain-containing protein [Bacillota bacterium]
MRALSYLFFTTLKNRIKELRRHPSQLILLLFLAAMLALAVATAGLPSEAGAQRRPLAELRAMLLALYAAMFLLLCKNGLSSGASFYSMADVHLLFSAPIRPQRILFYGLLRQLGASVLLGFFLVFQYSWLHDLYGLSLPGLLAIVLGYCLTVFCAQLTAVVLYAFTSGSERRRRIGKGALYLLAAAAVLGAGLPALAPGTAQEKLAAVVSAADGPLLAGFPVAGWLKAAAGGLIGGGALPAALGLGAGAAYAAALVALLTAAHPDFYEDVLKATEISFTAVTASKEGKMAEPLPARVKVGRTGIGAGRGAGVFYYKHRLERRRSRVFLLDGMTLLWAGICIVFSFFMREEGMLAVFIFATYMQLFSSSTGRWLRELLMPYAYMIPEPPFRKLIGVCRESILQSAAEAAVVMIPCGLIVGAPPLLIAGCVAARFGFALLFMAGNILMERLFGQVLNKALILGLFLLLMVLLALPGVAAGVAAGILAGMEAAMPVVALWCAAVSALIAFLCRDLLDIAELNNK